MLLVSTVGMEGGRVRWWSKNAGREWEVGCACLSLEGS